MHMEIRTGRSGDAAAILRVTAAAFRREPHTNQWQHHKDEAESAPDSFRLLSVDGTVAGVARIQRHELRIGSCTIVLGDVGEVSTHPDFERRGLATRLMTDVVRYMREEGCHISRLGGFCRFYSRFGYVPFPRGYIAFTLRGQPSRGGLTDVGKALSESGNIAAVRTYDAVADHGRRAELYELFNACRTGAEVRAFGGPPVNAAEHPHRIVAERDGTMVGYMFCSAPQTGRGFAEPTAVIGEAAVDPARAEALVPLLRHTLLQAHRDGARAVRARLPLDYALYRYYREGSVGFAPTLMRTTESSNMLRILDLRGLLAQIAPELQTRLRESAVAGTTESLSLRVAAQSVRVRAARGRLRFPVKWARADAVPLEHTDLLHLLLGLHTVDDVTRGLPDIAPARKALLAALFPAQPTATGPWG